MLLSTTLLATDNYDYDANGNRIKEYNDIPCDCNCPVDKNDWLTLTMVENDPSCDPGHCKLTAAFTIPIENNCFTHYLIDDGTNVSSISSLPVNLSLIDRCLVPGEKATIKIKLYRYVDDPNPCVITKTTPRCGVDCCQFIDINFSSTTPDGLDCCWLPEFVSTSPLLCNINDLNLSAKFYDDNMNEIVPKANGEICLVPGNNTITYKIFIDGKECTEKNAVLFCECNCPTKDIYQDWLTLSSTKDGGSCAQGECYVEHFLNIPSEYDCYTGFTIKTIIEGQVIFESPSVENIQNLDLTLFNKCIKAGEKYEFEILLYKTANDPNPCTLKQEVFCDFDSDDELPCKPDCFDDDWIKQEDIVVELDNCPGCYINISYWARVACGVWQDIQITSIEKFNILGLPNPNSCNACDDAEVYRLALKAIIAKNAMGFKPSWSDIEKNGANPCSTIWRASKASCWARWQYFEYSPTSQLIKLITINKPCNSDCCLRQIKVCRISETEVIVEDLGVIFTYNECQLMIPIPVPPFGVDCLYSCDIVNGMNEGYLYKKSFNEENIKESLSRNSANLFLEINVTQNNEYLNVHIDKTNGQSVEIGVFDINGTKVLSNNFNLNVSTNSFNINLTSLISGTYVYSVIINGIIVKSNTFIIVK